jgi:hypothetical protein
MLAATLDCRLQVCRCKYLMRYQLHYVSDAPPSFIICSSLIPMARGGGGSYSLKSRVELSVKYQLSHENIDIYVVLPLFLLLPRPTPSYPPHRPCYQGFHAGCLFFYQVIILHMMLSHIPNLHHTMYKRDFSIIAIIGDSSDQHL